MRNFAWLAFVLLAAMVSVAGGQGARKPTPQELNRICEDQQSDHIKKTVKHIQEVSVMVSDSHGAGSGVVFHRGGELFILTNWHVVDDAASEKDGHVEYSDLTVTRTVVRDGMLAEVHDCQAEVVIAPDVESDYDLALLRVRDSKFIKDNVTFYPESRGIPFVGMPLYHVGCFNGEEAPGSLTTGIISQHGRLIKGNLYDQVSTTNFRGSSGGGIFDTNGNCVGLLSCRSGETLGYMIPTREIKKWASSEAPWLFDIKRAMPARKDLIAARDLVTAKRFGHDKAIKSLLKVFVQPLSPEKN